MTRGYWSLRFSAFLNWSLRFSAFLIDCLVVLLAGVCVCVRVCVCSRRGTVEALHLCCSSKKDQHRAISEHAIKVALGRSGQARSGQVTDAPVLCGLCSAVLCCALRVSFACAQLQHHRALAECSTGGVRVRRGWRARLCTRMEHGMWLGGNRIER